MEKITQQGNKDIVLEAFDTLFNKRDYAKAETFWSPKYIQHSAHIEPGREGTYMNLINEHSKCSRHMTLCNSTSLPYEAQCSFPSGGGVPAQLRNGSRLVVRPRRRRSMVWDVH